MCQDCTNGFWEKAIAIMLDLVLPIEGKKLFSAHDLVLMDPTLKAKQKNYAVEGDDGDKRAENKCQQDKDCETDLTKKFLILRRLYNG